MKKKAVKKKAVKKLGASDSLNPAIGKMKQEVLKKKQKFKVEEKVSSGESSISLQITSPKIRHGGEFEDEVEKYLRGKFVGVDISVSSNSYEHVNDDSIDEMTDVNIEFSPIPKDESFEEMEEGDDLCDMDTPKWLDKVDNIISKENPDYEVLTIYITECDRGEE